MQSVNIDDIFAKTEEHQEDLKTFETFIRTRLMLINASQEMDQMNEEDVKEMGDYEHELLLVLAYINYYRELFKEAKEELNSMKDYPDEGSRIS